MTQKPTGGASICITNELARVVGKIAERHPGSSIDVYYGVEMHEREWIVTAAFGTENAASYLVDDETGDYVVAHDDTLRLAYERPANPNVDGNPAVGGWRNFTGHQWS